MSAPLVPSTMSLPASPKTRSPPPSPARSSAPSPPWISSPPPPPENSSLPAEPVKTSSASVPSMCSKSAAMLSPSPGDPSLAWPSRLMSCRRCGSRARACRCPSPPRSVSAPWSSSRPELRPRRPPMWSSPGPPSSTSLPGPPVMSSLPPSPKIWSLPAPAVERVVALAAVDDVVAVAAVQRVVAAAAEVSVHRSSRCSPTPSTATVSWPLPPVTLNAPPSQPGARRRSVVGSLAEVDVDRLKHSLNVGIVVAAAEHGTRRVATAHRPSGAAPRRRSRLRDRREVMGRRRCTRRRRRSRCRRELRRVVRRRRRVVVRRRRPRVDVSVSPDADDGRAGSPPTSLRRSTDCGTAGRAHAMPRFRQRWRLGHQTGCGRPRPTLPGIPESSQAGVAHSSSGPRKEMFGWNGISWSSTRRSSGQRAVSPSSASRASSLPRLAPAQ